MTCVMQAMVTPDGLMRDPPITLTTTADVFEAKDGILRLANSLILATKNEGSLIFQTELQRIAKVPMLSVLILTFRVAVFTSDWAAHADVGAVFRDNTH